ncbi:MAG: radical SAM family heme chaperone HemW [Gemmatimonadales bacterium]
MHLYLHVPFCARRCSYCDFAIAVRSRVPVSEYVEVVLAELRQALASGPWRTLGPVQTIYFGGGTPSLIGGAALADIVAGIRAELPIAGDAEVTVEANPEDVTDQSAVALLACGANRISLGVQSFDPAVLQWMHRVHGAEQPARAAALLRRAGLANLSLDLIFGLPADLGRDWNRDLDAALALEPEHLSLYGLTVEAHTPLGRWVARGETVPAPDGGAADEYLAAAERLGGAGFHHYEVSNAGRPGCESRHNLAYWRRAPYLGLGPSAHSAAGAHRWWNQREWAAYRTVMAGGGSAQAGEEFLAPDQVALEELYLGLRTSGGVAASTLPMETVTEWEAAGWACRRGSQVILTATGWLRLDALVSRVAGA